MIQGGRPQIKGMSNQSNSKGNNKGPNNRDDKGGEKQAKQDKSNIHET